MHRNFLLFGSLLLLPWNVQAQEKKPDDREKLIGTWNVVSMESSFGPDMKKPGDKVVFGAERVTLHSPGEKNVEASYVLRPGKMPAAMDLLFGEGERTTRVRAIYIVEGDRLKLCWCAKSGLRPEEFSAEKDRDGQDLRLIVLERAKAQEKKPDDREKLLGTWNVISFEPDMKKPGGKVIFRAEGVTLDFPGEKVEGTYVLRPGKMPLAIDFQFDSGVAGKEKIKVRAIYALEGDCLKMCWCAASGLRPEEFSARGDNPGQDLRLLVLERAKRK